MGFEAFVSPFQILLCLLVTNTTTVFIIELQIKILMMRNMNFGKTVGAVKWNLRLNLSTSP